MAEVSIRELRNRGGEVVDRVTAGEHLIVTRDGKPVAELRPLSGKRLSAAVLLRRWAKVPPLDPVAMIRDVDSVADATA